MKEAKIFLLQVWSKGFGSTGSVDLNDVTRFLLDMFANIDRQERDLHAVFTS